MRIGKRLIMQHLDLGMHLADGRDGLMLSQRVVHSYTSQEGGGGQEESCRDSSVLLLIAWSHVTTMSSCPDSLVCP